MMVLRCQYRQTLLQQMEINLRDQMILLQLKNQIILYLFMLFEAYFFTNSLLPIP